MFVGTSKQIDDLATLVIHGEVVAVVQVRPQHFSAIAGRGNDDLLFTMFRKNLRNTQNKFVSMIVRIMNTMIVIFFPQIQFRLAG